MKCAALFIVMLIAASAAYAITPTLDGDLSEWTGQGVYDLGSQSAPDGGIYQILITYDANNMYIGVNRDSSDRYLGDTAWDNDSFFFAIDTDGVASSGAQTDGYARVSFDGTYLPDQFYYFAGGPNFYESSTWNGSTHTWNGWTESGAVYGYQEANPDDELTIPYTAMGGSNNVMVWSWMTREGNGYAEASWPDGNTGTQPTFGDGVMTIPEPASVVMLLLGGSLAVFMRRRTA